MITNEQSICSQIDLITSLSTKELRQLWRKKIGTESSPHMQKRALIERLAYNTQETILGGLSEATQERLKMFNTRLKQGKPLLDDKIELVPGTILTREYKDRKHVIKILEHENVEYKGEVYTSLSAVARKITGTQWNGRKFFHVEDK